ncbi:MAG: hypothetical protein DMG57_05515 [Acidobacteria bacterium]|nr:MAG: hypothetical protein DMG57_05515 [Acidobacteriota bacterium]
MLSVAMPTVWAASLIGVRAAYRGLTKRAIAREVGITRTTVRRFLKAVEIPERAPARRRSELDSFREYLEKRWAQAATSALRSRQEKPMSYRIAGIDVHKKMLAVVVADVAVEGAYQFERRQFGSNPGQLQWLAEWLIGQEVQEVVMESTAQYWKPVWQALERYWKLEWQKREGAGRMSGTLHLAQAQSNRGQRGRKNDFADAERLVKRLVAQELILSFCARSRTAPVADPDTPEVPVDARSGAVAEPTGRFAGRGTH